MQTDRILISLAGVMLAAAVAWPLQAAGRVQLELIGEARGSSLAFQEWARVLSQAGIRNVRIRSGRATDRVGLEVRGTDENPLYVVTGIVKSRDELLLPAGRFTRRDVGRLARWLEDLAQHGTATREESKSAFGLSPKQFAQIRRELARPVGVSTKDVPRSEAVEEIGRRLQLPVQIDPGLGRLLEEDRLGEELSGLSCGTALAYVLRPVGLCLVPRVLGGRPVCAVTRARPELDVWPVGWESEKPLHDVLPGLYEFHNVNVQGVSAAKALSAIAALLKVPVLLDHNALARHGVDPAKVIVSHPGKRTTYSLALKKILFQARLKSEVRVDEAGKPFLWVSTLKPM